MLSIINYLIGIAPLSEKGKDIFVERSKYFCYASYVNLQIFGNISSNLVTDTISIISAIINFPGETKIFMT